MSQRMPPRVLRPECGNGATPPSIRSIPMSSIGRIERAFMLGSTRSVVTEGATRASYAAPFSRQRSTGLSDAGGLAGMTGRSRIPAHCPKRVAAESLAAPLAVTKGCREELRQRQKYSFTTAIYAVIKGDYDR